MALDDAHLRYPMRRHGMDHDRYVWSMLQQREPITWPGGATLALWINVSLQHFPLDPRGQPLKLPGAMSMPYPDLRHYTLRDYGNRVGVYRVLDALDAAGLQASFAVNACLIEQHAALVRTVLARGDELLAHSWSMDTPHAGGLDEAEEDALVGRTLAAWQALGVTPRGWLSPGKLQSPNTPELLRRHGIAYMADWVNDELPYRFHTREGDLWSLPLSTELEDRFVLMDNLHAEAEWAEQVCDAFDLLLAESRAEGGRLLTLSLHPWVIGQPHRMRHLETVLAHLSGRAGVWNAPPGRIVDAYAAASAPRVIEFRVEGAVARLRIRRAERKNALDAGMWQAVRGHCDALAEACARRAPDAPRVLRLDGEPGVFSAGADIEELRRLIADPAAMAAHQAGIEAAELALERLPLPTIAVIDGPCYGGGFGLAAACDFRVASSRASFAVTPARLGLLYGVSDSRRLLRVLGDHAARRLLMRSEAWDAAAAQRWGFIDELVEPEALEACAARWADHQASASRTSMAGTKLVLRAVDSGDAALLAQADEAFREAFDGADFAEGAAAFLERRAARFS